MAKRERETPSSASPSAVSDVAGTPVKKARTNGAASKSPRKTKDGSEGKEKAPKTAWNEEEDAVLIKLMNDLIKTQIWPLVKADGRLVHRGSYGVQYHAKMLLTKGAGDKSK